MIEIGMSTASFFPKKEVENTFEEIRKLDVRVVEVFLNSFSEYKKGFADILAKQSKGLEVHSVHSHITNYEPELFNSYERTLKDAESILNEVLTVGKTLNAKHYTFHGPIRIKQKSIDFERFGSRLEEIISICKQYNIKLCYENVAWAYYNYIGFFSELIKYSPSVWATLDTKQAVLSGCDIQGLVHDMQGRIATVHLCDVKNDKTCLPGKGDIDFYKLFVSLNEYGIQPPCLMEVYGEDYNSLNDLKESLDYLKELSYKASR